jgi:hypothetical protein
MKKCFENFILVLVSITLSASFALSQDVKTPTLKGADAINELKKTGAYDSLINSIKETKQNDKSPIRDFTIGQEAKLFDESGSANERFGDSVAISGNTMAIGVPFDTITHTEQGSVRIYVRTGTVWSLQATLTAQVPVTNANFGISVDIAGNTLVIGANNDTDSIGNPVGAAYVFTRSGTVWAQESKISGALSAGNHKFGSVVKINGGRIAVSDPWADHTYSSQGGVFVYSRSSTGNWIQEIVHYGTDSTTNSDCGESMDFKGEWLLMGCPEEDDSFTDSGATYAYQRSISGVWTTHKISNPDPSFLDSFGRSVSISNNSAAITGVGFQSRVNLYSFNGTSWALDTNIVGGPSFGSSVNLDGNLLIASEPTFQVFTQPLQGQVHVYRKISGVWTSDMILTASDGNSDDKFGQRIDFADGYLAVGVPEETIGANVKQGAVYSFQIMNTNWLPEAEFSSSDGGSTDNFGESVAISGDTAVVGAPNVDIAPGFDQGAVYVFVRSGSSWIQQAKLQASDPGSIDNFGSSVAIYGNRIVVGCPQDVIDGNLNRGSAYIFFRNGTTWTEQAKVTASDGNAEDFFGSSVDIQNTTAIIGARNADGGGAVYIFNRSGGVWSETNKLVASDRANNDNFGVSVAISNSFLIIGASLDDHSGFTNIGSAYIFSGVDTIWNEITKLIPSDPEGDIRFGVRVDISNETAIIGATQDTVGGTFQRGSAYVFRRTSSDWTQEAKLTASDGAIQDLFGNSVAIENNVVVIGVLRKNISGNADQGAVYVFERDNTTWTQTNKLFDSNGIAGDNFGTAVDISGTKIIVGTPFADIPAFAPEAGANQGSVSVYVNTPTSPTAANIFIKGRVVNKFGRGISNASLSLLNGRTNETFYVRTNQFGYFLFEDLPIGDVYVLTVNHKQYQFAQNQQVLQPMDNLDQIVFTAE